MEKLKGSNNPNDYPVVSQPSPRNPSVEIRGNRETAPSTIKWIKLLSVPTSPLDAVNTTLQWLFAAKVSIDIALVSPFALQVVFGVAWVLLASLISIVVSKEPELVPSVCLIAFSVILGFILGVL